MILGAAGNRPRPAGGAPCALRPGLPGEPVVWRVQRVLPWTAWPTCCKRWPMKAGKCRIASRCGDPFAMSMMSASRRCRCDQCALSDFPRYPLPLRQPGVPGPAVGALMATSPVPGSAVTSQQLDISPEPTSRRDELDVYGNPITRLAFERPHDELLVNAGLTVEVLARPVLDFSSRRPGIRPVTA